MDPGMELLIKTLLPLLLQLGGISFVLMIDPYIRKDDKVKIFLVVLAALTLILQNILDDFLTENWQKVANSVYGYSVKPVIVVLLMHVLCPQMKKTFAWIITGVNALIYMTAFFTPLTFRFDESGNFVRGPLGYTCFALSLFLLTVLLVRTIHERSLKRPIEILPPIVIYLLVVGSAVADIFNKNSISLTFLTVMLVSSILFVIFLLHLALARENERAIQSEQRIKIMMSQIRPHFLFNTLSTIQALCLKDPQKAFYTVEKFGTYLRNNMETLNQEDMIPFSMELEHTKTYAQIEMIRFPSIGIDYDIGDEDFLIPALTVQPIVENAIRHGVRGMDDGLVMVSTLKDGDNHKIVVKDNGRGFDPAKAREAGEDHIGIANVRERVETLCKGTLTIESGAGGTTVTIIIPMEKEKQ